MAGLAVWGLHTHMGWELPGLGTASKPLEVASLAAPARLAGRPSIAVLPFKNLSGDTSQDFFSDGITEDVITALGRFSNLLVIAKSASFPFKGSNASLPRSAACSMRVICSKAACGVPGIVSASMSN